MNPNQATSVVHSAWVTFEMSNHVHATLFSVISSFDSFTGQSNNESYTYVFQLCGDAGGIPGAGVIQIDNKKKEDKPTVIGTYNLTQAIGESKCNPMMSINIFIPILYSRITFKCT